MLFCSQTDSRFLIREEAGMSAWSVGAGTAMRTEAAGTAMRTEAAGLRWREGWLGVGERRWKEAPVADTPTVVDTPTVDTLVAWIPGEVIAGYMALVLALQADGTSATPKPTSVWWLIGAIGAAGLLTFLGGFSKSSYLSGDEWLELGVKVVLSAIAFALWSLVLPGSWWQSIHDIADNAAVVAILAGLSAAAFGLLAQGIVQRLPTNRVPPPESHSSGGRAAESESD